jgi:hypothetical protein
MLYNKLLSDEAVNWFTSNHYIVNGKFKLSTRFNAKMSGTDLKHGQDQGTAGACLRRDGFLNDSDYPATDTMTYAEYYQEIPGNLKAKAQKAKWFIDNNYHWVTSKTDFPDALLDAPVQVATEVCAGWDGGGIVEKCSGQPIQHCTLIYRIDILGNYEDFDQYTPFQQLLAPDYELNYNMQFITSQKSMCLRIEMQGSNVMNLQKNLRKLGYVIGVDGVFGIKTASVVKTFQLQYNLSADGIAGPITLNKINEVLSVTSETIPQIINRVATAQGVDATLALEVARAESGLNPKSTLYNKSSKSTDRGLYQWNSVYHSEIPDAVAFDPEGSCLLFCKAVLSGNLHAYWSASQPVWSKRVAPAVLKKYCII